MAHLAYAFKQSTGHRQAWYHMSAADQSTLSFFFFEDVVKDNGVVLEVMTTFHKRYFVT